MTLLSTSFLSLIATAIRMFSALAINKAIAIYVGPTGLALVGQFQNFIQLAMSAAQGGINKGVTKYTAEYGKDTNALSVLFSTAFKISISSSLFVGLGIILSAKYSSVYFLKSQEYVYIFVMFGITIALFVLNQLLLSIVNGLKEVWRFISINIIQSIYSLLFTSGMIVLLGLDGALIAMVTNQSVILLAVIWMLRHHSFIKVANFKATFSTFQARKLAAYAAMTLTSAITVPLSHLLIRNYLGEGLGWEQAGYWQAIWYISTMYLMVVTTALGIYYLPRLSEISDREELRRELIGGYKVILPVVLFMALGVFVLKDLIIWLLFTQDFYPMRELFLWQLVGDVLKLAGWLLSYLVLAKAMARTFIITEVLFSVLFVILSIYFVENFGLVGVTYAFAMNYFLYLLTMTILVKRVFFTVKA